MADDADLELLRRARLFEGLSKKSLEKIKEQVREVDFEPGTEIVTQGRPGGLMYIIVDGTVDVLVDGRKLASLGPGDHFGEMSLFDDEPRSATVLATSPVHALSIARFNFRPLIHEHAEIADELLTSLSRRLRDAEMQYD
jgi:CRP-like cAMP-binding protein